MKWLVIATLKRGRVDPPEPVDEATQAKLDEERNQVHGVKIPPKFAAPLTLRDQEVYNTLRYGGNKRWE